MMESARNLEANAAWVIDQRKPPVPSGGTAAGLVKFGANLEMEICPNLQLPDGGRFLE